MPWYDTIFDLIDFRSFSNLWFWIVLAVAWSSASHWVLGVPFDMVSRARRRGGEAQADLEAMLEINVRRIMYIARGAGVWLIGFASFLLSGLLILGFWYGVEFAQAVFLLALPISVIGALSLRQAAQIEAGVNGGQMLCRRLTRHRMMVQGIGIFSIFVTALWGMWHNMTAAVL
ncbi:MAG: component of SufBCD complex [Pseudorhodobacter sp.]